MKNQFGPWAIISVALLVTSVSPILAKSQAGDKSAKVTAKSVTCPACHMKMALAYSDATPVPVVVHGKTYYCCPNCAIGEQALTYMKVNKKTMSIDANLKSASAGKATTG